MKQLIIAALVAAVLPMTSCTKDFDNSTVDEFDLSRYLGEWYEVARYNHSFERGMDNTMAEYILQDNGKVFVLNTGWKDGKFKVAEGKAKYKDPEGNPGALKVSFFLFFYSEYNVMMVDENYQISLVGSKSDNYLCHQIVHVIDFIIVFFQPIKRHIFYGLSVLQLSVKIQ